MRTRVLLFLALLLPLPLLAQRLECRKIMVSPNLEIIPLSECAWVHVSYSEIPPYGMVASNGLIYRDQDQVFLFDTPMTEALTIELVNWIENELKAKIVGFVPNHWHEDCMGGLAYLHQKNIPTYAHQLTIDLAKSHQLTAPQTGFKDSIQLKLNQQPIFCEFPGAAHSLDNIVVWIPSEKILFAGCMVKELNSKTLGNTADGDLKAYPETIRRVLQKYGEARIVIPGHGSYGDTELIRHTLQLAEKQ